jgi:sugar transferase (PEP-CTERM system associated)
VVKPVHAVAPDLIRAWAAFLKQAKVSPAPDQVRGDGAVAAADPRRPTVAASLQHFFVNFGDRGAGVGRIDSAGTRQAMIRLFKHYIPYSVLLLGIADFLLLMAGAETAWALRLWQIGSFYGGPAERIVDLALFAAAMQIAMVSVGVYSPEALLSVRFAAARLVVAMAIGMIGLSLLFFLAPPVAFWRSSLLYALLLCFVALVALRALLRPAFSGDGLKRRVLVLGAGARAARVGRLSQRETSKFIVVGFVAMNDGPEEVEGAVNRADIASLPDHLRALGATEIVLALEERRNALPLADLLRAKTAGARIHEFASFIERETGRVDLRSLNPSWLIFSDGFSSGRRVEAAAKRLFDVAVSLILLILTAPVILLAALAVKLETPGPAFYRQRRVGLYGETFDVLKIRSMRTDAEIGGKAVWATRDDPRVTRVGAFIRKSRIDEIPQAWSVLKGEMSFVGPRPERPQFVADFEERLPYYAERHVVKPGITGWAQINYPYGASVEDAREKLEYDLYYAKNYSPFLDLLILMQTLRVILWPDAAGAR